MLLRFCIPCGNKQELGKYCTICGHLLTLLDSSDPQEILNMPTPKFQNVVDMLTCIDYVLQKEATRLKREGNMAAAIACLCKADDFMPLSGIRWGKKDYLRIVEFLKDCGQFDTAREAEKCLMNKLPDLFYEELGRPSPYFNNIVNKALQGDGLLYMDRVGTTCGECSKYQGRVYSIYGYDRRFPKLPDHFFKYGGAHKGCHHTFLEFSFSFWGDTINGQDVISYSNRPFIDERTPAEMARWDFYHKQALEKKRDKEEYDLIREHLPEIAPKSFGGYRRMKELKSENFIKLMNEANCMNIDIDY